MVWCFVVVVSFKGMKRSLGWTMINFLVLPYPRQRFIGKELVKLGPPSPKRFCFLVGEPTEGKEDETGV